MEKKRIVSHGKRREEGGLDWWALCDIPRNRITPSLCFSVCIHPYVHIHTKPDGVAIVLTQR